MNAVALAASRYWPKAVSTPPVAAANLTSGLAAQAYRMVP